MKHTMRRTLALVMALMLALPTFVLADDAAVELEANGQATINGLALEEDPVLDGDLALTLDGLSLDLDGLQTPTEGQGQAGQPSEGGEVSVEGVDGGAAEQPGASEAGAPEETPVELEDGARTMDESIPDAQPLMPPDYAVDVALEGENVTDPAMMANDGEPTPWKKLRAKFDGTENTIDLFELGDCIASEGDTRLLRASNGPLELYLGGKTINRNLKKAKTQGNVIYTTEDLSIRGPGTIKGGNSETQITSIDGYGGGIAVSGNKTLILEDVVITENQSTVVTSPWGCGGGVYLGKSDSESKPNKLIMYYGSKIESNTSVGYGGGVFLDDYAELEMYQGAFISDNEALAGGGVVVGTSASFNMNGGSITRNNADSADKGYGGGVSVRENATFTMEKGEITGNHAYGNIVDGYGGGGVYVGGTFTMTGGTIEGNYVDSAYGNGGGVDVNGKFIVGKDGAASKVIITGNKKVDAANNVYLPAGKTIFVEGKLSNESNIGVTTEKKPNGTNGYIPITNSFSRDFVADGKVFQSDDTQYEVGEIPGGEDNKELGLGLIIVHKPENVDVSYDGKDHGLKVNVTVPSKAGDTVVKYKGKTEYDQTTSPTFTQVGKHTVAYEVSNSDTVKKYCFPAKGKGTVTIRPVVSIKGWTYGEKPNDPKVAEASLPSGASLAYEYFTDKACTKKTTTSADGASAAGGRPRYAGTYYVRATVTVNGEDVKSDPAEFTIAPAQATVKAKDKSKTYGAADPKLEAAVSGLVKGDKIDYKLSRAEGEDVGKYRITPAGDETQRNYKVTFETGTLEITVKGLDNDTDGDGREDADGNVIITLNPAEYTYDGNAKEPAVTVTDKDTQKTVPEKEYNVAYSDNVNTGTAKVKISDVAGGNYVVKGVKSFTINKAAMTVVVNGYKAEYDGRAHGIEVTVTAPKTGYTVRYGEKEGTYDRESLTYTDVGEHTVYYQVTAENYVTKTGSATVEITSKGLDNDTDGDGSEDADGNVIIALDPAEYTYDGTAKEPAVTVTDKDTGLVVPAGEYKVAYKDNVDAGTAKVTISDVAGGNYVVNGVKTFTIKEAAMTVAARGYKGEYDGKAHGINVTVTTPKTGYTVKYGEKEGTYDKDSLTYTDAGNYTVYYQVTAQNYETVNGSATVEITTRGLDNDPDGDGSEDADGNVIIALDPAEYTYDGTAKEPAVTVTDKDTGLVVPAGEYKVAYKDNVDAGTAKVTISDVAGGNYVVNGVKTFTIKEAAMTVAARGYKGEYDGKAHGINVTVTTPKTGYTVKYGEKEGTYDKDSLTYTDAGVYTVYYKVTAKNYVAVTGSAKVEITAKDDRLTIELGKSEYTYNGEGKRPSVTVKYDGKVVPATEYKVTYSNNKHAGTAKVTISDVSGGQYTVSGNKTFTILPKTVGLKWKSTAFVYDGDVHVPTAKATGLVKKDKCKVSVSGAATEAGNHTARATKLSNPDYALPKKATKVFIISARGSGSSDSGNARFVAESKIGTKGIGTVTYNGKAQEPGFEVKCIFNDSNGLASNTVLTVPASEYKVTYHNNVDVGKATVEVTDVPGGNYVVNFRTEFTIARRKVTVTAKDQKVKTIDDVKTGVKAVKMKGLAKGHTLESVKLDIDIKTGAKKGEIIPVRAKIVDAEGNDVTRNYKLDYVAGSLAVTAPEPLPEKPDFTLLAQMKTCGDQALRIAWTRVPGAKGYEVTFVKEDCSFSKAKVFSFYNSNSCKFTDLKKNTAYKAYVRAWKLEGNKRVYIGRKSPVVCAFTGDVRKHKTNAGSVRVNASRLSLKVGGKATIRAAVSGVRAGKDVMRWEHALLRWYSDNANVATVNAKGEVRAVAAGECTVYALAANGVRAAVKVKVKK